MRGTGLDSGQYDASVDARALVERTTGYQGLAPAVADDAALSRVATILRAAARAEAARTGKRDRAPRGARP